MMIVEGPAACEGSKWAPKTLGSREAKRADPVHIATAWSAPRKQGSTKVRGQRTKKSKSPAWGRCWVQGKTEVWSDLVTYSGSPGSWANHRRDKG